MKEEYAVRVENVTKVYKLYDKASDRLKDSLGLTRKKCYKEHYALNDISFKVKKGETLGIIGTNGSGKSTILKIITGVLNPTQGQVQIDGRISALLELGAGFNMEYTGIENVYLNGTMIGFSKEEIDEKMDAILDFADIGDFVNQPVKTYSSGMFVRLAFAVAINIDPEILIVDEALSVGDVFFQAKCYKKFDEFKEMGKTIIFVSHDLSSINRYCDRVVLLNKGVKLDEGEPKDMVDLYKKVLVGQREAEAKEKIINKQAGDEKDSIKLMDQISLNPDISEYGKKDAEIIDFGIIDDIGTIGSNIMKGSDFSIILKVRFNKKVENPIFAFTIRDLKGNEITGTNNMFENKILLSGEEGEVKKITFKQHMNLQGGEYLLSFGVTGFIGEDFVVYHRLYDACGITVISNQNTVGFYDMESEVTIV
ncbi:teichoic acid transport system ATP-binding protein [Acetitomaculum ruminis DSM 5522]|uniref:Teichoic acid transport system ATP-binding protein n=1 Tax=Acetitomaculum ruminis DSM 5522 TaxID=1120918 RepID=A0A1I0VML4_9FIRM|nr:ABC transporter ATP-binding protein [Acetitomaculum ruminis]SFA77551.1 teichoic acid transport system ATP-binding protein [Acetitomaculum ruminis DSM 5522]